MTQMACPVCKMQVDAERSPRREHAGQTYAFCSANCQRAFERNPARYAAPSPAR